jgi:metal-responsive CopG/Arc/MetJ family transcriptional regulator
MPTGPRRPERLMVMLSAEEMAAVDDFRFKNRMQSRAAAIRELIKRALSAEDAGKDPS